MNTDQKVVKLKEKRIPTKAMILAAGLGKRMRPITDTKPKPLVRVKGKALLDHALDALQRVGVTQAVVNVHHHADQIIEHIENRLNPQMEILISDETNELLDSAGGIINALPKLGKEPFFLLNADSFWLEGFKPNLLRMAEQWDPELMDMQLLLAGMWSAIGFGSRGDFMMDADGRLKRRDELEIAPFAYAGAAVLNPSVFDGCQPGPSTINRQFDEAIEKERLFGVRLEGLWLHVGTPEAIIEAEDAIARSAA